LAGGALLAIGVPTLSACRLSSSSEPDPLKALADAAAADADKAAAIAKAHPDLAVASAIATARKEQHAALRKELARAAGDETNPSESAPPKAPPAPTDRKAAATELTGALRRAQDSASALVPTLPTYRAGLVGSVAAGCASLLELFA
jgi:hypothetical protein